MRKVFCVIVLIICMFMVCGCDDSANIVLNNMSDLRINYFEGKNEIFYANLSCGYREENFAYDGESTRPIECGVLSFGYFEYCSYNSIEVELEINGNKNNFILEKSPYEEVYMADIEQILNKDDVIYINLKNQNEKIQLNDTSSNWAVNYKKAINIASEYFIDTINNLYFNGQFNAECYLKIISKIDYENKYWYFSIMDKTGETHSCVIDINSGEVITSEKLK